MKFLVCFVVCVVVCSAAPPTRLVYKAAPVLPEDHVGSAKVVKNVETRTNSEIEESALFKKQAEGAHYSFSSSVDDGIMDHAHYRSETRDGLTVEGSYSYSDGFFRRTVHYLADDKGFRVVKEENEAIGDGPVVDSHGKAVVKSSLGSEYTISAEDYEQKTVDGLHKNDKN